MRSYNRYVEPKVELLPEVCDYKKPSGIYYSPNYLIEEKMAFPVEKGSLLTQLLRFFDSKNIDRNILRWSNIIVNKKVVPRDKWLTETVNSTDCIEVHFTSGGGGGNFLSTIATLAVVLIAAMATWYIGGAGGIPLTSIGLTSLGYGATAGYLAGIAVMFAGSMLVGSLFKQSLPKPNAEQTERSYVVESSRNNLRLYEAQELVIGRVNVAPSFAASYYSTFSGYQNYWHGLFQVSAGSVQVKDIFIGDTPLTSFKDVDCKIYEGWAGEPLKYFDKKITEVSENINVVNSAGWIMREAPTGVRSITFILQWPSGMYWMKKKGGTEETGVRIGYRWRKKGDSDWNYVSQAFEEHRKRSFFRTYRIDLPKDDNATYEFGIVRQSGDNYKRAIDAFTLVGIQFSFDSKSLVYREPFKKTLIELRILASEQLNGRVEQLNCIAESYGIIPTAKGAGEIKTTTNPAALALKVLTDKEISNRPCPIEKIDWPAWKKFYDFCEKYGWTYSAVRTDGAKRGVVVSDILAAGLGGLTPRGVKISVGFEDVDSSYVDTATPWTCWGFELSREFPIYPVHGLRVEFPNRDKKWKMDETTVYADGYNVDNAENVVKWSPAEGNRGTTGIDNIENVTKLARVKLAQMIHRPETIKWYTNWRSLDYHITQKVAVAYDTYLVGSGGGHVTCYIDANDEPIAHTDTITPAAGFILNDTVSMRGNKTYVARSTEKGIERTWRLKTKEGIHNAFYFDGAAMGEGKTSQTFTIAQQTAPKLMMPILIGESGRDVMVCTITNITRQADFVAQVTALPSKTKEILTAIESEIPPWDSLITDESYFAKGKPNPISITSIYSDETVAKMVAGAILLRIKVNYRVNNKAGVTVDYIECQYRLKGSEDWDIAPISNPESGAVYVDNPEQEATYELRVRCVSNVSIPSEWVYAEETVVGLTTPPDDIVYANLENGYIKINYTPPIDFAGYEVFIAYSSKANVKQSRLFSENLFSSPNIYVGDHLGGNRTFFIYAVDIIGNRSLKPAVIRYENTGAISGNAVACLDYRKKNWKGKIENGHISELSGCIEANSTVKFYSEGSTNMYFEDTSKLFYKKEVFEPFTYYFTTIRPDDVEDSIHKLSMEKQGIVSVIEYDINGQTKFYDRGDKFYKEADSLFYGDSKWVPLPSEMKSLPLMNVRISFAGGYEQAKLCQLKSIYDAPDLSETIEKLSLNAEWNKIKTSNSYRAVKYLDAVIMETPNIDPYEIRKRISITGEIELLPVDAEGKPTTAIVTLYIRGY